MGRADFELANLELIQRNSTEETKIVWQTRVPQKVDPASIARFRSAVRGEYADTKLLIYGLFQKGRVLAQDAVAGTSFTSTPRSTRRLLGLFSNYARRFPTTPLRDISSSIATSSLTLRSSSSSRQRAQNPFALRFAAHGKTEPRSGGSAAAVASSLSTSWFSVHVISSGSCELTSATIMRTVATWG